MGVLDGKAAIVTGSARGIGRATAELLAEQGARVLINDLDGDVAEQAASEIGGETAVFGGDLTQPGVPDQLVQKAVDEFGQIDIIVNNAGYTWDGVAHKMTDEQFQAMLEIHTVVPFRVIRAAAPHLREPAKKERDEGREVFRKIVNVSSISGTMGNAGQVNYSAAKAGVVGLTKTLAKEWGGFKINVNAVAFGFVETRLTASKEEGGKIEIEGKEIDLGIPEQMRELAAAIIPLGRAATPEEAAGPVFFLCSPWAELRARPGAERDRRPVRRDVHLAPQSIRYFRSTLPPGPVGISSTELHAARHLVVGQALAAVADQLALLAVPGGDHHGLDQLLAGDVARRRPRRRPRRPWGARRARPRPRPGRPCPRARRSAAWCARSGRAVPRRRCGRGPRNGTSRPGTPRR